MQFLAVKGLAGRSNAVVRDTCPKRAGLEQASVR